jgi:hypothetical protein
MTKKCGQRLLDKMQCEINRKTRIGREYENGKEQQDARDRVDGDFALEFEAPE